MSKYYVRAPDTKFHQKISPQRCFRAEKLTYQELKMAWGRFFSVNPLYVYSLLRLLFCHASSFLLHGRTVV